MKATIKGVEVEGTVTEIQELIRSQASLPKPMTETPVYPIRVDSPVKKPTGARKKRAYKCKRSGHKADCPRCGRTFRLTYNQLKKTTDTPNYCSKSCMQKAIAAAVPKEERTFRMQYVRSFKKKKGQLGLFDRQLNS